MSKKGKHYRKIASHNTNIKSIKRPSISVCLIVKDEERFLDKCLQSVKGVADEIIIIDTGSQDNTVNIAGKYTDKIYFHPWKDSYSEARNHYLEYATGDWIFQIDADEELVEKDIPSLLKAVKNPDIDAIMLPIVSHLEEGKSESVHNMERLFRKNGIIHYEGRIHERLTGYKRYKIVPAHLIHYGYDLDNDELSENKNQRRIRLLRMDIEEFPDNPLPYHYLSCCYLYRNLYNETLKASLKALELAENRKDRNTVYLWTRYNAAMAYYHLKDFKKSEAMALSAIATDSRHLDSYYLLTAVYFDQSKWSEAIKFGNEYLLRAGKIKKCPEEFGTIVANSFKASWKVLTLLGIAYYETGMVKESDEAFRLAESGVSNPFNALKTIGTYFYNKSLFPKASLYLKRALDLNRDDKGVTVLLSKIGAAQNRGQTISCCMIVKNEERFLEKCLSSVKDNVDEIIIVDTGSTDKTIEIAGRFTDKIYFHPWENSFGKARNKALQYAKGDWVLQIDADEELMPGSGPAMRQAVNNADDHDIIYIRIYSAYAKGRKKSFHNFERLFRNNGRIHYEGNIHEQIAGGTKALYSSAVLWHYGYDVDEIKAEEKFARNAGLLKKEIEKDPENPMHYHNLSLAYFSRDMNEDAIREAKKAIELSDSKNNTSNLYAWSHFIVSMGYYRMSRLKEAKEYAEKSLNKYPEHMDTYYILTVIASDEQRWDDVIKYGRSYLDLLESIENKKENVILGSSMNEGHWISILIGNAYYAKNSFKHMEEYYKKAYDAADEKWPIWWNIGVHHMDKSGDMKLAAHFLDLSAKEAPEKHDVWYMLAKLNKKLGLKKNELECLEKIVGIGTADSFIYNRLLSLYIDEGLPDKAGDIIQAHAEKISVTGPMFCKIAILYIEKGRLESAVKCYMRALEKDVNLFEAWASLGELMMAMNKREDSKLFLQKALSVKNNDIGTILKLCNISSEEGDILSTVTYCDLLLKALHLPQDRVLNSLDDLMAVFAEISSSLSDNGYYQNQLSAISESVSKMRNQPV